MLLYSLSQSFRDLLCGDNKSAWPHSQERWPQFLVLARAVFSAEEGKRPLKMLLVFQDLIKSSCLRPAREGRAPFFFSLSHCFQLNWQETGVLYLSLLGAKLIRFHFSDVSATARSWGRFRSPQIQCALHLHKCHLSKLEMNQI